MDTTRFRHAVAMFRAVGDDPAVTVDYDLPGIEPDGVTLRSGMAYDGPACGVEMIVTIARVLASEPTPGPLRSGMVGTLKVGSEGRSFVIPAVVTAEPGYIVKAGAFTSAGAGPSVYRTVLDAIRAGYAVHEQVSFRSIPIPELEALKGMIAGDRPVPRGTP